MPYVYTCTAVTVEKKFSFYKCWMLDIQFTIKYVDI